MKYASFNNSHNNCHSNERNISTKTHVQINRSIFASYGTHAMKYFASLGIFVSGTQDEEVTTTETVENIGQQLTAASLSNDPSGLVNSVKFLSCFKCVLNKKYIYLKCLMSFFRWDKTNCPYLHTVLPSIFCCNRTRINKGGK